MSTTIDTINIQETALETELELVFTAYNLHGSAEAFAAANGKLILDNKLSAAVVLSKDQKLTQYAPEWLRKLNYPIIQPQFSIGKSVNFGIKKSIGKIIIKTDPDIVFTKECIDLVLKTVKPGIGLICLCAETLTPFNLPPLEIWKKMNKRHSGYGACFAMHKDDWFALKGYDERICGWGADDTELHIRARKKVQLSISNEMPLYHISHQIRRGSKDFPFKSKENLELFQKFHSSGNEWNDENWGNGL